MRMVAKSTAKLSMCMVMALCATAQPINDVYQGKKCPKEQLVREP